MNTFELIKEQDCWRGSFSAMASPCEVLMDITEKNQAEIILQAISSEAFRIEQKFSRYRKNNIIDNINNASGKTISVDDETARLLDFADNLYQMSNGLFDITSGVLRKAWKFDGSDNVPESALIEKILPTVGWDKVTWKNQQLTLLPGMEIDLGGIGKEYAVDKCIQIATQITDESLLINFGGDLAVTTPRRNQGFWSVGRLITNKENNVALFRLTKGAIATSGDAHRYLLRDGIRYSHVLNPKTGWPVTDAPHTVSIAAPSCIEAGMLSTLAMLQGEQARAFLDLQEIDYWID